MSCARNIFSNIKIYIYTRKQFSLMNLFWNDEVHTPMNDTRSRDVTRKRRHRQMQ